MKLIKLNSYISESFINIDTTNFSNNNHATIIITNNTNFEYDIYINSYRLHINTENKIYKLDNITNGYLRIYVCPEYLNFINFNISIYDNETLYDEYSCSYNPAILNDIDKINYKSINNIQSSYMLIRTNPKLSGNIKLVIDDKDDLYLDTFKINNELSEKRYRKRSVSIDSYYSNDVRNVFKAMSSYSLYDIPKDTSNQFNDVYNYGVKLNTDRLYSENFSILAPLWINNDLPDYFVIFKVNDFKNNNSVNEVDRLKYCIENNDIVKFVDLRNNSKLGKYLRNHQSEIKRYSTSAYISRHNIENADYDKNLYNLWYGISVDNGILSNVYENVYDIDKINNQVEYDNYITLGYERNKLLNPYLINLEFMFNDKNSKNLEINQYIGFYIYNYDIKNIYKINNKIYDENFNVTDLESFKQLLDADIIKNRLFNISVDNINNVSNFYRFKSINEFDTILDNLNNIPNKNILSCPISYYKEIDKHPQFITLTINEPIQIGEHLRIIDKSNNDNNLLGEIYDVISSYTFNDEISILYNKFNNEEIKYEYGTFKGYDTYNENDKEYLIKEQIIQIVKLFESMNDLPFEISTYSNNSISFMSLDSANVLQFERISNEIIYDYASDHIIHDLDMDNKITYFNNFVIPGSVLKIENDYDSENILYTPINFEVWNNRKVYIIDFTNYNNYIIDQNVQINTGNAHSYSIDKRYVIDKLNKECLTVNKNNDYISLNKFNISYYNFNNETLKTERHSYNNDSTILIMSPKNNNEFIIQTDYEILVHNGIINLYSISPIYINIAGFSPIKDFAFNVLDPNNVNLDNTTTQYILGFSDRDVLDLECKYNKFIDLDINALYQVIDGEFIVDNKTYVHGDYIPFGTNRTRGISNKNILRIVENRNDEYFTIEPRVNENYQFEKLEDYFVNDISLVTPTSCKWNLNGTDVFGNNIKEVVHTCNVDVLYKDINSLGYSTFKYTNDNSIYIYNNINDNLQNGNKLIDEILDNKLPILSIFSNNSTINNKFSILFYNKNFNSLETIFRGNKISLNFSNVDNIFKYDGYLFSFISLPHSRKSKNEIDIIISERERMCLMIYYTNYGSGLESNKINSLIDNIYNENEVLPINECPFIILSNDVILSDVNEYNDSYIPIIGKIKSNNDLNIFISAIEDDKNKMYKSESYTYDIKNIKSDNITDFYIDLSNIDSSNISVSVDSLLNTNFSGIKKTYNNVYEYVIGDSSLYINEPEINEVNNRVYIIDNKITYYNDVSININKLNNINDESCSFYVNPEFTDIFEYSNKEDSEINNIIGYNLVSSNTNIRNVNSIKQLWINRQYKNNKIINDIDCISNYNPFLTDWDNILRIYGDNNDYSTIKGYYSNKNNKIFFGSVAPVINDEFIELTNLENMKIDLIDEVYTDTITYQKRYNVKINLSDSLLSHIKNHTDFINMNWRNDIYDNIDEYIKNMLSYYYIINNKNVISLFRCYNSNIETSNKFVNYDSNIEYEIYDNITFNVSYENNNYYLNFELPFDSYQYSIKYKIFK